MTSPNVNVVMVIGAIGALACIVLTGFDSSRVSLETLAKLLQAAACLVPISFSLTFGSAFAKAWRVFMIFKNINFNGKTTRDEHLLLVVLMLISIDLVIVLPWVFADPITCHRTTVTLVSENFLEPNTMYSLERCASKMQILWVILLYVYKSILLLIGLYFTWQTRHVTLPSLKDAKQVYIVVFTVITMGILALPVILVNSIGAQLRYSIGSLILFIVVMVTLTLLFIPKVLLVRKQKASGKSSNESMRFMFTESMRKTQEHLKKCNICCFGTQEDEGRYAQEVLHTEIETLKKTIKEKDVTIRELTDRLYFGVEKFKEYLTSPKKPQDTLSAMRTKFDNRRVNSFPARRHVQMEQPHDPNLSYCDSASDCQSERRYSSGYHDMQELSVRQLGQIHCAVEPEHADSPDSDLTEHQSPRNGYTNASFTLQEGYLKPSEPSPNYDSAIDNNSPSPTSSDIATLPQDVKHIRMPNGAGLSRMRNGPYSISLDDTHVNHYKDRLQSKEAPRRQIFGSQKAPVLSPNRHRMASIDVPAIESEAHAHVHHWLENGNPPNKGDMHQYSQGRWELTDGATAVTQV